MRVCVYAICKNEERFVERWMKSMGEADMVVVTDTGSDDGTVEKLRALGAEVFCEKIEPWRFDTARNISLAHVPSDADICVCTDLDEIFVPGWRESLERAWIHDGSAAVQGKYLYNWSLKPDGTPDVQFTYFKIHSREDFKWVYPVHEVLKYGGKDTPRTIYLDGVTLNHYPDREKPRRYLPLLEAAVSETPEDTRMLYYLGREYMYVRRWTDCIATLNKYLSVSRWNEERSAAGRWIAEAFYRLKNNGQAYKWYYFAISEMPTVREPYVEFAETACRLGDWLTAAHMAGEALKITKKSATFINMGYAWDETPYKLGALACYKLGMYKQSLEYIERLLPSS